MSGFFSVSLSVPLSHYLSVTLPFFLFILPLSPFFSLEVVDLAITKPIEVPQLTCRVKQHKCTNTHQILIKSIKQHTLNGL